MRYMGIDYGKRFLLDGMHGCDIGVCKRIVTAWLDNNHTKYIINKDQVVGSESDPCCIYVDKSFFKNIS